MIWIILIILAIAGKFLFDRNERLNQLKADGGIVFKYQFLIDYMLSAPNALITSTGRDHVYVNSTGQGVATYFKIIPVFNGVHIEWKFSCSALGDLIEKWTFQEDKISKKDMIGIIDRDITAKTDRFLKKMQINTDINGSKEPGNLQLKDEGVNKDVNYANIKSIDYRQNVNTIFFVLIDSLLTDNDVRDQAIILKFFIQLKHNNYFIDDMVKKHPLLDREIVTENDLSGVMRYLQNGKYIEYIKRAFSELPVNSPEALRFIAIACSIKGDFEEAEYAWNKASDLAANYNLTYSFCLLKSKTDVLIYKGLYAEAYSGLSLAYNIIDADNNNWQKIQLYNALIKISNHVTIDEDVELLRDELPKIKEMAEFDDEFKSAMNLPND